MVDGEERGFVKRAGPVLVAVALLAIFLTLARKRSEAPGGPDACVRAMFAAAREGRASDYVESFMEPLRGSLANTARGMGEAQFRQYIKDSASPIVGIAFSEIAERGQGEVTLRCELVFKDRNEVQRFLVRQVGGRWRIADMTPAERIRPPVPYGKKVFE
jgi:hypothetical protein